MEYAPDKFKVKINLFKVSSKTNMPPWISSASGGVQLGLCVLFGVISF